MSRKDYQLIADILRFTPGVTDESRRELAHAFSHALHGQNPRFDPTRFLAACGIWSSPTSIRELTTMERYELSESA